jgi:hypothetical protein
MFGYSYDYKANPISDGPAVLGSVSVMLEHRAADLLAYSRIEVSSTIVSTSETSGKSLSTIIMKILKATWAGPISI